METVFTSELSLSSNPNVTWKTMDLLRGSKAAISKSQKLIVRSDRLIHQLSEQMPSSPAIPHPTTR